MRTLVLSSLAVFGALNFVAGVLGVWMGLAEPGPITILHVSEGEYIRIVPTAESPELIGYGTLMAATEALLASLALRLHRTRRRG